MKKGNITHMFFVLTFILCMSIKTVRAESAGIKTDAIDSARKLSVATQKVEREMNVEKLMSQYAQVESILLPITRAEPSGSVRATIWQRGGRRCAICRTAGSEMRSIRWLP